MKTYTLLFLLLLTCATQSQINDTTPVPGRWTEEKINQWYDALPWLVGCNYYPATAINQIEMWQASTWDSVQIEKELSWAEEIGMNTLRVFLHDLVWEDDEDGLYARMDTFLVMCQNHGIRPWFVFFDDCHHPNPVLGVQPLPVRAYHNSGWNNCPAHELTLRYAEGNASIAEVERLKGYVQNTLARFKDDSRVLMWELYNEPGRGNRGEKSNQLVYDSWVWAREINPSQPITSTTAGSVGNVNIKINRINSDLHSIHTYSKLNGVKNKVENYLSDGRPVMVTEWIKRPENNVGEVLPYFKENKIGAVNWGFDSGKSGTIWPWSSRKGRNLETERANGNVILPGAAFPEPEMWFHDLFRMNGSAYNENEILLFKQLTDGGNFDKIMGIATSDKTDTSLTLSWNTLSAATSYQVFANNVLKATVSKNTANITELQGGKTYFIEVWAKAHDDSVLAYGKKENVATISGPATLVAHYPFENTTQNSLNQLEGNAFGEPGYVDGKTGMAMQFDGVNDYVSIERPIELDLSISFWIKTIQAGGTGTYWYKGFGLIDGEAPGIQNDFGVSLNGGKIAFGIGNTDVTVKSAKKVNDGNWHHVAVTRSALSGEMIVYIDGVSDATGTGPTGEKSAPNKLHIGNLQTDINFFNGLLDEVSLYTGILTYDEVAELYQAGISSIDNIAQQTYKVFPNPTNDIIQISSNEIPQKLSLFGIDGKLILSDQNSKKLITSDLTNGIYFLHIVLNNGNKYITKIIIED